MKGIEPGNTDDYILQCVQVTSTSVTSAALVCNHTANSSLDVDVPVCAVSAQISAKDATGATDGLYYVAVANDTTYGPGAIVNCSALTSNGVYEVWILGIPYSSVTG
jgi:hypothetical protein